jgi:RNA polymerase sigma factor (sigma-70 family)
MTEDAELLQRYAASRSGEDFAELVRRHLPLVYAAALRQLDGAVHRAEDVAQTVFIELARRARPLSRRTEIVGWLHTTTHHAAAKLKRSEQRRQVREQEALHMQENSSPSSAAIEWERLRPVLDEVMLELNDREREVILMRYFQAQRLAEVGRRLGLSEDAVRMRVERALDKLRQRLARREITSTTAALAVVLANQPAVAASASLAATVTAAALAGSGTAIGAGVGAWTTFVNMTKLQMGISGALAVVGTAGFALQAQSTAQLHAEAAALRQENAALGTLRADNWQLVRTAAEVEEMRRDDAALARLHDEATALRGRLQVVARAEEAQRAQRRALTEKPDLAKLDQTPRPRYQIRPQYPVELRTAGIEGEVLIDFVVDANGEVRDARSVGSALRGNKPERNEGDGEFVRLVPFTVAATPLSSGAATTSNLSEPELVGRLEAAAVDAVRQWQFDAGRKGGRSVNTRMTVPIVFSLARKESP